MDLLAAWLLFPLAAVAVSGGIGLLIQRAARVALPGVLLLPLGMAGLVCLTQLTTYWSWSAEFTLPLVVVVAVAGLLLGRAQMQRPDPWPLVVSVAVFMVFAAPVVLSGEATFAGYGVLGDTSIHMIGADALLTYGRDFSSLPPSSYEYSLVTYYGASGYPSGGPTAVGALTSLTHQDVAWTFQAFLAILATFTAGSLWSLFSPVVSSRPLRALLSFIAAQPALVFAYAMQGSVKEIGAVFGVVLMGALIPVYADATPGPRRTVPLAVGSGCLIGFVGLAAGVWLAPMLLLALVLAIVRSRPRPPSVILEVLAFVAFTLVLSYQVVIDYSSYVGVAGSVVTAQEEFGNLLGPLDPLHIFGVWLTGDYRVLPSQTWTETRLFAGLVAAAFLLGVIGIIWRRFWTTGVFLVVSLVGYAYVTRTGSPWADGKAMTIVSPAILFGAGVGIGLVHWIGRRRVAWLLATMIAAGVLWTNAYQYHDVSLAPRDRLEELAEIGQQVKGQGPTLYTEFEEFGKHFLRAAAPEGSSEGWQRRFDLSKGRNGQFPRFGFDIDLDHYTDRYLTYFRTIVVPRGFFGSRPSSIYERVHHGTYYDAWQRTGDDADKLIRHESLGAGRNAAAKADCQTIRPIAQAARAAGGRVAFAELPQIHAFVPSATAIPKGWYVDLLDGSVLHARGQGRIEDSIRVPRAGRYTLWIEGSFRRDWSVRVDGREIASVPSGLEPRFGEREVAKLNLTAGPHVVTLNRPGGTIWPGNGGPDALGPVVFASSEIDDRPADSIPPSEWRSLCGRSLDWIEAVRN